MKRAIAITAVSTALVLAAGAEKYTGVITDNMCGGDHKSMNMGPDDKCVTECVKAGAKYALWDGKTAWVLSDQKSAAKFAAKKVTITGRADAAAQTLKVDSIAAAR